MRLDWEVLELAPEHPFRISRSTRRRVRRVWIRVRHEGLEGWGEAAPSGYYGEDAGSVVEALEAFRPPVEAIDDPEALVPLERALARRAGEVDGTAASDTGRPDSGGGEAEPEGTVSSPAASTDEAVYGAGVATPSAGPPREPVSGSFVPPSRRAPHAAARAGVTAAAVDLWGKRLERPLWRLRGLDPSGTPVSSFTLGIDDPEVMARKARAARGWPVLKVKLGVERDREEAILEAVRSEAPDAVLRVDANAGWGVEEAAERVRWLAGEGVELVEQPLPPDDLDGLRRVTDASPIPVVVDESCVVAGDVPALAGRCDGVNVKLAKCGGPLAALRLIHTARACGLKVMLGCMLETSLGIAPAAHLSPLVDWADLDGAHLLAEDPFRGPGPVAPDGGRAPAGPEGDREAGRIVLGDAPGLGVSRREA